MTYSLVIPLKNEAESLLPLYKELKNAISSLKKEYEIIFVDDGSTDNSYEVLKSLENKDRNIKVIKLRANFGKSYALDNGLEASIGEIIITLDADLQDDPAEIPKLISKLNEGFDFVNGWWVDVGTPERIEQAERYIQNNSCKSTSSVPG